MRHEDGSPVMGMEAKMRSSEGVWKLPREQDAQEGNRTMLKPSQ